MAHMLENDRSMIYVGETPWHRLGVKLDKPPTTREAIVAAGLDWEVGTKPLVTCDGEPVGHRAAYRMSDGKIFGVVGPEWHPLQNAESFAWFDPFLDAGEATIETAGSLFGGSRIWVLAKLNRDPMTIVPGDDVLKYLLLATAHDGSLATRAGFTPTRVVCQNTLSLAIESNESKLLRIRHTKNQGDVLKAVRDIMNTANASFEASAEQYRYLASRRVNVGDIEKYVDVVFTRTNLTAKSKRAQSPALATDGATLIESIVGEVANDAKAKRESKTLETVRELFENGTGNSMRGVRGTWWGLYNAVTEFTTHKRGNSDETRLAAQFNDGARINARALQSALAMAA